MIIEKVLNNNLVVSRNNKGKEIIIRGKGIGFKKKIGDIISEDSIERIYMPQNESEYEHYYQLLSKMPIKYLTLSEEIINIAKKDYAIQVSDSILLPICDHISGAVERYNNGLKLENPMLWDIKNIYPLELKIGKMAVKLINKQLNILMDEHEASYVALYFVNAQLNVQGIDKLMPLNKRIQDILGIVQQCFKIKLNEQDWYYRRFLTHLKFFVQRIVQNKKYKEENDEWFNIIKNNHPLVYQCVVKIGKYLYNTYKYELNKEEMLYLMLHVDRVIRRAII